MKKPKRIKEFQLGSQTIKVKYCKTLKGENLGLFDPHSNTIKVRTHHSGFKINEQQITLTFFTNYSMQLAGTYIGESF